MNNETIIKLPKQVEEITSQLDNTIQQVESLKKLTNNKMQFVAHMGAGYLAPENTMVAFQNAYNLGYKFIETDAKLLGDGSWIIFHDDTVDRMTDGVGNVSTFNISTIKNPTIDNGYNRECYPNTKIPTLEEYCKFVKKTGVFTFLEIKSYGISDNDITNLNNLIQKYNVENNILIMCTDLNTVYRYRTINNKIITGVLFDLFDNSKLAELKQNNVSVVLLEWSKATQDVVNTIHSNNMFVGIYTCSSLNGEPTQFDTVKGFGVDFIITDNLVGGC